MVSPEFSWSFKYLVKVYLNCGFGIAKDPGKAREKHGKTVKYRHVTAGFLKVLRRVLFEPMEVSERGNWCFFVTLAIRNGADRGFYTGRTGFIPSLASMW